MKYEIVDHGIHNEQYWQGCGVSGTRFTDVFTGIGAEAAEAYQDALDQVACNGWDADKLPEDPELSNAKLPEGPDGDYLEGYEDHWYYISIRVSK